MDTTRYYNNNIDHYSLEFINDEFIKVNNLTSANIYRVSDYRRNTLYDTQGVLEFNINLFIFFVQNDERGIWYAIHHYYEDFNWNYTKKFSFKLHKVVNFPFNIIGKNQVDYYFSQLELNYGNTEYLF